MSREFITVVVDGGCGRGLEHQPTGAAMEVKPSITEKCPHCGGTQFVMEENGNYPTCSCWHRHWVCDGCGGSWYE